MRIVLLTGFEPFGADAVNPSGDAVRLVASRWTGPEELVTDVLPVTFAGANGRRAGFIHVPWAAGQAPGGEPELELETIARGLEVAIRMSLDVDEDLAIPGGALS
jgi:pyroglutamyl-peptidase